MLNGLLLKLYLGIDYIVIVLTLFYFLKLNFLKLFLNTRKHVKGKKEKEKRDISETSN